MKSKEEMKLFGKVCEAMKWRMAEDIYFVSLLSSNEEAIYRAEQSIAEFMGWA